MWRYILRRLVTGLVTLLGITVVTFAVIQFAPGDPASAKMQGMQDKRVSAETYAQIRAYYGLDKPIHVQYARWLGRLATGDLGASFHDNRKVSTKIREALWPTLSVALVAILAALAVSIPIGIRSAVGQGGAFDRVVGTALYALYSVPSYVMAMILILYVGVKWELLPIRGMRSDDHATMTAIGQVLDVAKHGLLIVFCFFFGDLAYDSRFVRQNLLEVVRQDYIRTARAKGLGEGAVILKHAFLNTLIPLITLLGMTFPFVLGGSVILEEMFTWPGLGRLFFQSVLNRDYPTIMALNFITAALVLGFTLLADLAYGIVDPRIRYD